MTRPTICNATTSYRPSVDFPLFSGPRVQFASLCAWTWKTSERWFYSLSALQRRPERHREGELGTIQGNLRSGWTNPTHADEPFIFRDAGPEFYDRPAKPSDITPLPCATVRRNGYTVATLNITYRTLTKKVTTRALPAYEECVDVDSRHRRRDIGGR